VIGLYFGGQVFQTEFGNFYGNIELDAVLEEVHEWMADATSNPVELGAPVTDHIIETSDKLRIRGLVTDTPIRTSQELSGVLNASAIGTRTQPVFDFLHELIKLKEPVIVYTKHRIYEDMAITAVTVPRAAGNGEALEFTVEFIHIRKVSTQLVDVPKGISVKKTAKASKATGNKAEAQKNGGAKQAPEKAASSTPKRVVDALRTIF